MVKLNYSNRKSKGARLGQLVQKDLAKKQHSTSANRDPHLELSLAGKELGEEGLRLICDGLLPAIQCDAIKLDDLILSSCSLPSSALRYLAPIIVASAQTLERIELQGNAWDMKAQGALQDWEEFLIAFRNCVKMRKVDFSDNELGDKGIETLVRVYTRETRDPIIPEDTDDASDEPLSRSISGMSVLSDEDESIMMDDSIEYGSSPGSSLAASAFIQSRRPSDLAIPNRGLRSIAYIHLNNVGMTDLSALHLTYLLPYHHLPHILLRRLDTQVADSTLDIRREDDLYDPESLCRGVMYDIDQEITPLGKKILESVEKVRRAGGMKPQLPTPLQLSFHPGSVPPSPDSPRARRNSDSSRGYFPDSPSPSRKDSISSIRTMATSHGRTGSLASMSPLKSALDIPSQWTDVLKIRPKIQGEILKTAATVHVSQLWSAGIKLLSLARMFTLPQPVKTLTTLKSRTRATRRRSARFILPPSPISPGTPTMDTPYLGGLNRDTWMKILLPIADPEGVLSDRQARGVVDWAADRSSLASEREWAGKLPHVQMWRLVDVSPVPNANERVWIAWLMRFNHSELGLGKVASGYLGFNFQWYHWAGSA